MRVLVTGVSGFIGSYLVRYLSDKIELLGMVARNERSVLPLSVCESNRVYYCDFKDVCDFELDERYDVMVHLASANDIDSKDAREALDSSAWGTRNALEICRRNGIGRFIYFSTFQVYGAVEECVDEGSPLNCGNDYGLTHLFAEEYVRMFQRRGELGAIVLRPTNVFGRFGDNRIDRWSLVPACFCRDAVETGKVVLKSSGRQTRDFVSLEDVSGVVYSLILNFERFDGRVLNLARGETRTIRDVAESVCRIATRLRGEGCELVVESEEPRNCSAFSVDIEPITKELGYSYSLEYDLDTEIEHVLKMLIDERNG